MPRALLLTTLVVSTLALLVSGWTAWSRTQPIATAHHRSTRPGHPRCSGRRVILGAPVPDPLSQGRTQGPCATALSA